MADTSSAVDLTVDPLRVVSEPVDALLADFLGARERQLTDLDPRLGPVVQAVHRLVLTGGKRLRPAFVYWGYRAGGAPHSDTIWHTAAAFELLQSFALIHDAACCGP